MTWTRITDPDTIATLLPAWLGRRMVGLRGAFGLLLTTNEVLKLTSIAAVHQSSDGIVLLDVLLDHAGAPEGIDMAWWDKHYLGAPIPGATLATVNLAHVIAAVEFTVVEMAQRPGDETVLSSEALDPPERADLVKALGQTPA